MRIALAGLGKAAFQGHLPAITRLEGEGVLRLVAAADPSASRRADAYARKPSLPLFDDVEAMLAETRCDVLVVATEPSAHDALVEVALRHGLHVVCEKPLAVTRAQHDRIARAHAAHSDRGLISVHQYRYSPGWAPIARTARIARRLRVPFYISIDVERPKHDAAAASPWRADPDLSGGMLADHGAHYLSLAWTIDEHIELLAASRDLRDGTETSSASLQLGSGMLSFRIVTGAPGRSGRFALYASGVGIVWTDELLNIAVGGRSVIRRRVRALADREHVDVLYRRLYRDMVDRLAQRAWRAHRTAEALAVGAKLIELLERAPASTAEVELPRQS